MTTHIDHVQRALLQALRDRLRADLRNRVRPLSSRAPCCQGRVSIDPSTHAIKTDHRELTRGLSRDVHPVPTVCPVLRNQQRNVDVIRNNPACPR